MFEAFFGDVETREKLEQLVLSRSQSLRLMQRSRIVLLAAAVWDNEAIGAEFEHHASNDGRWQGPKE